MEFSLFCAIKTTRESGRGTLMKTLWTEFDNVQKWLYRFHRYVFFLLLHPTKMNKESKKKYIYIVTLIGKFMESITIIQILKLEQRNC